MSAVPKSVPSSTPKKLTLAFVLQGLVDHRIIDTKTAAAVQKEYGETTLYPLAAIVKFGVKDRNPPHAVLSMESLTSWLASYVGVPYLDIDPLKLDIKSVVQILPAAYSRRLQVVPVKSENGKVTVATSEPFALNWIDEVQQVTRKKVEIVLSSPSAISHFIEGFLTVGSATKAFKSQADAPSEFGQVYELKKMLGKAKTNEFGRDAAGVIRIVDWLFQFAHEERATDIHLEPKRGKGLVRFRIDGHMRVVYEFEPELMIPVVSRIKILGEMAVDERRRPQDGHIRYKLANGQEVEMRLSTIPVQHGEKLVARIFDPSMSASNFETLGFTSEDIKKWESLINLPHGLVLVTGPTGSGKSTTLHASLRQLASDDVNICTIEDPIEIVNSDLNQMQVHQKIDLTFSEAIRAFLRQDPDIIMVGEIRDADAGKMAIQAALTGHLVLSTLHTNDAISSITRLIDLGMPSHLITASVRGMMAQRLVRKLCVHCKEKIPTPKESWEEFVGLHAIPSPEFIYAPVGCRECKQTGYSGRLCVYEIVMMDRDLKRVIRSQVTHQEMLDASRGKYVPLLVNGAQKIIEGLTSLEEVMRVVF